LKGTISEIPIQVYGPEERKKRVDNKGDLKTMFTIHTDKVKRMIALLALMLVIGSILAPLGQAQSSRYPVEIENASRYDLQEVYLSRSMSEVWGPDLLGRRILRSGYTFTTYKPYGSYDLKLVDEDGDVCTLPGVTIKGNTTWQITDAWLLRCEFR
jgi:hypothetical protein